jgi:hypothetical protein
MNQPQAPLPAEWANRVSAHPQPDDVVFLQDDLSAQSQGTACAATQSQPEIATKTHDDQQEGSPAGRARAKSAAPTKSVKS